MTHIGCYLTFNGNCREAMTFYQDCLGGDLLLETVGESLLPGEMPKQITDCIVQATLTNGALVLQGSDMAPATGVVRGNNVSLVLNCSSEEEINTFYKKLSAGGKANSPIEETIWGALFGDLTDKFGNQWLLNFNRDNNP